MQSSIKNLATLMVITGVLLITSCKKFGQDEILSVKVLAGIVSDIDGNSYNTTTIGDQTWMAENLRVTHFRNGDPILHVKSNYQWFEAGRDGIPAWRYYNDDPSLADKYGILYNGFAVSDPRGLGVEGWRVPGDSDWEEFLIAIGGKMSSSHNSVSLVGDDDHGSIIKNLVISYRWSVEGEDLSNQLEWENNGIRNVFDSYGFNLVAAGQIDSYGNFYDIDKRVEFWSYPSEKFSKLLPDGSDTKHATINAGIIPKVVMHSWGSAPQGISIRLVKE